MLKKTVPFGLAYHHSGLTSDERKLVEEAYSSGVLCLLTCTSTLAAGINLPARRFVLDYASQTRVVPHQIVIKPGLKDILKTVQVLKGVS